MSKRVLIAGASIAGPVAAFWLAKNGFDVTIVERAPHLRLGGQNIDISDAARDIVRKMGLEAQIKARHTGEQGLQFVDRHGRIKARFPVKAKGSMTREIEILRGDLADILYQATRDNVTYQFGDKIQAMHDNGKSVSVEFASGKRATFDVVIAADGMNSSTRDLIFNDHESAHYIGCWGSYFTIPRIASDTNWWRWYTSPTGVVAFLRPDNKGSMRASVNYLSTERSASGLSLEQKQQRICDALKGAGWQSERIMEGVKQADDIFLGPLSQIKAQSWYKGRLALAGDAAHCPTPYTGMGTTLAIIGAYVLAQELSVHNNHEEAFRQYEKKLRPFVEQSQSLPPGVPKAAYAQSRFKVALINGGAAIAASKPVQFIVSLFSGGNKDENQFTLPDYPAG